jgi:hypothetical protein
MSREENASESPPRDRNPFTYLTNKDIGEQTKRTSWYSRFFLEKKEAYVEKQKLARQKKGCASKC